jgi:hypothetical protein
MSASGLAGLFHTSIVKDSNLIEVTVQNTNPPGQPDRQYPGLGISKNDE